MRILHVSTYDGGGAGLAAIRFHEALLKQNVQSSILFLHSDRDYKNHAFTFDHTKKQLNVETPSLTLKNYLLERFFSYYTKKNKQIIKELQKESAIKNKLAIDSRTKFEYFSSPVTEFDITKHEAYKNADIIHFHFVSNFLDFESFFRINTKPVYWSLHDENLFYGAFHFEMDFLNNQEEYSEIDSKYTLIKQAALANSNCEITLFSGSNWLISKVNKLKFYQKFKLNHLYYPVNSEIYRYIDKKNAKEILNLPLDKKIFLFAAGNTNVKRKGFDILLPLIVDDELEDCYFLIMGNLSEPIIRDNVKVLGKISDELLMPILYASADFYILPSRAEGFSYAMSESLCCGTPVIAFDVADHQEFIGLNKLGYVLPEISTESLKQCVKTIIQENHQFDNQRVSTIALSYLDSIKVGKELVSYYQFPRANS
jgi:glycosyltransferase involved in cell wall biosynthesis